MATELESRHMDNLKPAILAVATTLVGLTLWEFVVRPELDRRLRG